MNKTLARLGREHLKKILPECTDKQILMFKRMYAPYHLSEPIEECIELMKDENIINAIEQTERTIEKNKLKNIQK